MRQDCCYYRWWFWQAAWKVVVVMGGLSGRDIYFIVVRVSQKGVTWRVTRLCPSIMFTKLTQSKKLSVLSFLPSRLQQYRTLFPPSLSAWISINHFNPHDGQTEFKLGQNWNRWGRAFKVRARCKAEWFIDVTVWETAFSSQKITH